MQFGCSLCKVLNTDMTILAPPMIRLAFLVKHKLEMKEADILIIIIIIIVFPISTKQMTQLNTVEHYYYC